MSEKLTTKQRKEFVAAAKAKGWKIVRGREAITKQYGLVFYPFFLDGVAGDPTLNLADRIHPNRDGIQVIVKNIMPSVETLLARIKP